MKHPKQEGQPTHYERTLFTRTDGQIVRVSVQQCGGWIGASRVTLVVGAAVVVDTDYVPTEHAEAYVTALTSFADAVFSTRAVPL